MTYSGFLIACRKMAGLKEKPPKDLSRAEFAAMTRATEGHIRNTEEGYGIPGREHLEAAARAAGLIFEDCIVIPGGVQFRGSKETALQTFTEALNDWRELAAIDAADALQRQKRERRPKTGGRTRKRH